MRSTSASTLPISDATRHAEVRAPSARRARSARGARRSRRAGARRRARAGSPRPARTSCGPRPGTSSSALRLVNAPCSSRCATIFFASDGPMPATRASSGALAVLSSTPTRFTQLSTTSSSFFASRRLVDVVLVLADADALRIDLHELGERILQPPRDADRAAHREIEIGELLARDVARRVDARAGLADRHAERPPSSPSRGEHVLHERLGLAAVRCRCRRRSRAGVCFATERAQRLRARAPSRSSPCTR